MGHPIKHFKTITKHRHAVIRHCAKCGILWQGLRHDLSKYLPSEFLVGAHYYLGEKSPNEAERQEIGYSLAWMHHKGRNKHHFEYWIDYSGKKVDEVMQPAKMPNRYIVEMFIDRVAASKVYNGMFYTDWDAWHYYNKGNTAQFLHPYTRRLLEKLLYMNGKYGEEATYRYIRKHVLHNLSS